MGELLQHNNLITAMTIKPGKFFGQTSGQILKLVRVSCNSETCHCFLFTGEIYQDQFYIQDAIDQDDFATRDVFQDDSDEVQIFEDKLLEDSGHDMIHRSMLILYDQQSFMAMINDHSV